MNSFNGNKCVCGELMQLHRELCALILLEFIKIVLKLVFEDKQFPF